MILLPKQLSAVANDVNDVQAAAVTVLKILQVVPLLLELQLLVSVSIRRGRKKKMPSANQKMLSAVADVRTPMTQVLVLLPIPVPVHVRGQPSEPL
jgi:hypothetical protein